ncbi:hypothetical protein [Egicoccus sp. AB-alg6-2]|uniref:T3SS (YopN, CesT) and YbjN peptide-binding chaperone 1 n=1 Tax=Egicoccus sp. AB-alg6-2 TaxID=3242692 RepID=UPI00359D3256
MSDHPTAPDHDERDVADPAPASEPDAAADDRDEHGPGGGREDAAPEVGLPAALAAVVPGLRPPRPPRRTGVFVDPDELRDHVGQLLRSILGGYEVDAFGNFTFLHEGARIFVTVGPSPIGPQVGVFSVTNLDIDLSPPLANFLLTTNHTLGFGSFSYDGDNRSVWLRHTLLGTTLDGPELQSAVASVATTAAHVDDPIKERFGGRTFAEAPDEVQRRAQPPEPNQGPTPPPNASGYL